MPVFSNSKYNPNPITKMISTFILGFTVVHIINPYCEWLIAIIITIFFLINGYKKSTLIQTIVFTVLFTLPKLSAISKVNPLLQILLSLPIIVRMFILPFMAGKFMITTSDVGSILSSMDKLGLSRNISIPIAVMFRFFPSFKEEKKNIKRAMKIRGISFKNPLKYVEYVTVPLLIISSNISDDIAKAAETKAIENPIRKTRYISVKIQLVDFIYLASISMLTIGGLIW